LILPLRRVSRTEIVEVAAKPAVNGRIRWSGHIAEVIRPDESFVTKAIAGSG
jgi:hypothetical protein